jgi:Flp pilus assembly secretin CpaC
MMNARTSFSQSRSSQRRSSRWLLAVAALALVAPCAFAKNAPKVQPSKGAVEQKAPSDMRIPLDQARAIASPGVIRGVVVGNPSIAAVSVQNDRLVFVTGRSYGTTNVILVGERGPIYQAKISVVSDESDSVILTRGGWSVRYDCAPECKRRPDISDEPTAFGQTMNAISTRASAANQ